MSPEGRASRALAAFALALFAPAAAFCGLYLDDYSFFLALDGASLPRLWEETVRYVPGRNLHVPFFAMLLRLTGSSVPLLHLVSSAFDAGLAVLAYHLARRVSGSRATALIAAAAFVVAPNHGETHFWITLIPQCQIPMALVLGAFILALDPRGPRFAASAALFSVALFTYDQVFLLWPLLLVAAWRADPRPAPARYAALTALFGVLNGAHLAVRYLSPYASGGRPLISAADVPGRLRDAASAVASGLFPWPTRSHAHWAWTALAAVAGLAAAWWLAKELRRSESEPRDRAIPFLFGAAWTVLAYGPNLFWFISPRHNLLPSFGWTLLLAVAAREAYRRRPAARPALAAIGAIAFTLATVSNVHEATQWADSARLKDGFADAVRRLPQPLGAVFTLDAPRRLRRAPAFNLFHDVSLAAGRAVSAAPPLGDYSPTPTRAGIVYYNDLSVHPPHVFHWQPAAAADLLAYDPASRAWTCAASLELAVPGGEARRLDLRSGACPGRPRMELDAALLESRLVPVPDAPAQAPAAAGLVLADASLSAREGVTEIGLTWIVGDRPAPVIALVPRGLDASGAVVLDSVFPRRSGKGSYPLLWPLVDDTATARRGHGLRQRFALRRSPPAGVERLELDVFSLEPGRPALRLGRVTARVSRRRE